MTALPFSCGCASPVGWNAEASTRNEATTRRNSGKRRRSQPYPRFGSRTRLRMRIGLTQSLALTVFQYAIPDPADWQFIGIAWPGEPWSILLETGVDLHRDHCRGSGERQEQSASQHSAHGSVPLTLLSLDTRLTERFPWLRFRNWPRVSLVLSMIKPAAGSVLHTLTPRSKCGNTQCSGKGYTVS